MYSVEQLCGGPLRGFWTRGIFMNGAIRTWDCCIFRACKHHTNCLSCLENETHTNVVLGSPTKTPFQAKAHLMECFC